MYILRIQEFLYIEFHILVKLENFWENLFSRSLLMQNPFLPAVQISFDLRIGKEKIPDKGPALEQLIPYLQYHWQSGPCIINFAWIPEENQYERSGCSRIIIIIISSLQIVETRRNAFLLLDYLRNKHPFENSSQSSNFIRIFDESYSSWSSN